MNFKGVSLPYEWCEVCCGIDLETVKCHPTFGEPTVMHNCKNMNVCIMAEQAKDRYYEEDEVKNED